MQKTFPYHLGKRTYRCPACGRKTFKRYEDCAGAEIAQECGRCNREVKCRYHMPPREYFRITGKPLAHKEALRTSPPVHLPSFISPEILNPTVRPEYFGLNPLYRWLCTIFRERYVRDTFVEYLVGFAAKWGGSTVFWQYDQFGKVRSGKIMAYDAATGHRRKSHGTGLVTWAHVELKMERFNLEQCFFGAHIAAMKPQAKILVVESEKTAIVLCCKLKELKRDNGYAVVACGGASNLTFDPDRPYDRYYRFRLLLFRNVVLIPDADMVDRWQSAADRLNHFAASVSVFDVRTVGATGSADIADVLTG